MQDWWREAVIYQVYPRSFHDSTGNGIGDLPGITRRLDHIASLGVDAVWLSPFFTSPMADMGYDVSNYTDVDPLFGTMDDFDTLISRAHDLGLKVIIDQVLSHTSIEHPWFAESRASRDNPRANWYVWADPKADGTVPTNWPSVFGGSAWEFDPKRRQYYLHNFLTSQPDINFHEPAAVDALLDSMRFWLERGVDGFRLDTVNFYVHDDEMRDNPPSDWTEMPVNPYEAQDHLYSKTQPENLEILKRMRALTDEYEARVMVGEVGEASRQIDIMAEYTSGGDKLHLAYSFEFLGPDKSAEHYRSRISKFLEKAPNGWPCWAFSNHDVPRHATRWTPEGGDMDAVAKQSVAMLCAFPGTLGLYQGEELGLPEADILFEELTDPPGIRFWPDYKGRDGCRTPMVWDESAQAGFTTGTPWLPVKTPQSERNVASQEASNNSVLHTYREVIAFRKERAELRRGETYFFDLPEPILAIERMLDGEIVTAIFNLSESGETLKINGAFEAIGPQAATLTGTDLALPAHGYVYLKSTKRLDLGAL